MIPVISIVLPTFNRLQYLPSAVESVFAQTWPDWELIIVDDGSDAATRDYLRTLHDPPQVNVMWLPHTGNPGAVRNAGLREARGEFIAFLNCRRDRREKAQKKPAWGSGHIQCVTGLGVEEHQQRTKIQSYRMRRRSRIRNCA